MTKKNSYNHKEYKRVVVKMDPRFNKTLLEKGKSDPRIFAIEQFMLGPLSERFVLCDEQKSDKFIPAHLYRPLYDIRRIVGYIEDIKDDLTEAVIVLSKCNNVENDFFDGKIIEFNLWQRFNQQEGSIQIMNAFLEKKVDEK